ncbi:CAP domain-containing protein [Haloferax sp. MBLA0078]|uniref:CAP domain-containing protein n=1 Tax=Haloferax marinum TaxID=2666143 RepID=A0A6A8G6P8_9EURY|nr:CAP domain-containing protein [Haloferax sp. CBA1150]MRW96425.1 CAP domain-containing protein [Haloferax marinum]
MGECEIYGCDGDGGLSYTCRRCGQTYCSSHRLPESHNCLGLSKESKSTKWFKKSRGGNRKKRKMRAGDIGRVGGSGKKPKATRSPDVNSDGSIKRLKARNPNGAQHVNSLWTGLKNMTRGLVSATWTIAKIAFAVSIILAIASFSAGLLDDNPLAPLTDSNSSKATPLPDESTVIPSEKESSYVSAENLDRHRIELLIQERVNKERKERGLSPVDYDLELQEIARYHSEDMAESGYFAHTSPSGESMGDRYDKFGYECRVDAGGNTYMTGSENIAQTYHDENLIDVGYLTNEKELANGLMNQWMNSTGHRDNILTPEWENIGIGVYIIEEDGKTTVYATQNFC